MPKTSLWHTYSTLENALLAREPNSWNVVEIHYITNAILSASGSQATVKYLSHSYQANAF